MPIVHFEADLKSTVALFWAMEKYGKDCSLRFPKDKHTEEQKLAAVNIAVATDSATSFQAGNWAASLDEHFERGNGYTTLVLPFMHYNSALVATVERRWPEAKIDVPFAMWSIQQLAKEAKRLISVLGDDLYIVLRDEVRYCQAGQEKPCQVCLDCNIWREFWRAY